MAENKAKLYLLLFRMCAGITLLATIISISLNIAATILTQNAYSSALDLSIASDISIRKETYIQAITISPEKLEAYKLLLDTYAEDGVFSKSESEEFLAIYNTHHKNFSKSDPLYGQLQADIGLLYLNGYEGDFKSRMRMAMQFLLEADQYLPQDHSDKLTVHCYCQIGNYYEDYIWDARSVREVSQPVIDELITGIEVTLAALHESEAPDALFNSLGFDVAVCNLLFDQRDVLAIMVPKRRVFAILDDIYQRLPSLEQLQKEQTRQLLETLNQNKTIYYDMIERAYLRKGE